MKNLIAIALLATAIGINQPSASAQNSVVKATIPFNFVSGPNHVAAGTYTFSTRNESRVLSIRDAKSGVSVVSLTMPSENAKGNGAKLIFHRYGNQYYLSAIGGNGSPVNVRLNPTKEEKRARMEIQQAGLFPSDPVLIALSVNGAE